MTTEPKSGAAETPYTTTVTAPESWKRVLDVEIDRTYFDGEYQKNLRLARKQHMRPGFRKGKVPLEMVEKDLGGEVRRDTLEAVVPRAYQAAVVEHGLRPITDPVMQDLKMGESEPVKVSLAVEIRPEIEAKDYDDLPLTPREPELAEGVVEETLNRLADSRAVWDAVERPAIAGDQVKVDITPLDEAGEPDDEKAARNYTFEVGAEGNFAEFDEAMTGASIGDDREVTVSYPDDYTSEDLRGRTVTYRIAVNSVNEKSVPVIDDAFAGSLKEGQTLLELRASIRDELLAEETKKVDYDAREEIVDLLVERNPVELPPSLVERYLDSSVEQMKQRSAYMGKPASEDDLAAFRQAGRPQAERSIRAMVILEAIRRKEDIEVSEEMIEAKITEIAEQSGFPVEGYRKYVKQNGDDERIAHEIGDDLVFDLLRARAVYKDA